MQLSINHDEATRVGHTIQQKSEEFGSLLSKIAEQNENLKEYWKGTDADYYTEKITEQAEVMQKLKNSINDIGAFIVSSAEIYRDVMEEYSK